MELLEIIIMIIGFSGLGVYQHYKIKSLKDQIDKQGKLLDYQKGIFESLKIYVDIFQPEKIKDYVKISEETIKMETTIEIEKYKEVMYNLLPKLEKSNQEQKKLRELTREVSDFIKHFINNEYSNVYRLLFQLTYFVSPDDRKIALDSISDGDIKKDLLNKIVEFPYVGDFIKTRIGDFLANYKEEKSQIEDKKEGG